MGGGHFQKMMHLRSYVPPLELHIMARLEDKPSPILKALPAFSLLPEGTDAYSELCTTLGPSYYGRA
jgi:hypothetical protein